MSGEMVSFDVFDTIVSRITYEPTGIFSIVEKTINEDDLYASISKYIKRNYKSLRIEAEKNAVKYYSCKNQVSFDDIYYVFKSMTGCTSREIELLQKLEIEVEKKCSIPISENIRRIHELLAKGEKVVLISDMYLSGKAIKEILWLHDDIFDDLKIYSSADFDATKKSGNLYKIVKEKEKCPYDSWQHIGDNRFSDVLVPRQLGIKVDHWYKKINKASCFSFDNSEETATESIIGGLYNKNIIDMVYSPRSTAFWAAILLTGYVKWIIDISISKEISKLLFIARDGYILKKIADRIIEYKNYNLETEYVYSSRIAWNVTNEVDKKNLKEYISNILGESRYVAFIDIQATGKTFKTMAKHCGIDPYYFCYVMLKQGTTDNNKWFVYSSIKKYESYIEVLCRAPHGVTKGYEKINEVWEPILDRNYKVMDNPSYYYEYVDFLEKIVDELISYEKKFNFDLNLYRVKDSVINNIFGCPSREIVEFLGEIRHEKDNNEESKFAPLISAEEAKYYLSNIKDYNGAFFDFSVMRLPDNERSMIEYERKNGGYIQLQNYSFLNGKRIVLYGAGERGTRLYNELKKSETINIISWVDIDYLEKKKNGMDVVSLNDIKLLQYDYLIITIAADFEIIKDYLIECGIPQNKIISLNK